MNRLYIKERWELYEAVLPAGLTANAVTECRDAFYGGVIGAMSIMEASKGAAADEMHAECNAYVIQMNKRLEAMNGQEATQKQSN